MFQPGNKLGQRFEPGNTLRLAHGGRSGQLLEERAAEVARELDETLDGKPGSEPRFAFARYSTALAIARLRLLTEYLDRVGFIDGKGRVRPVVKQLETAHASVLAALSSMGMTPSSAGRLGVDLGRVRSLTLAERLAAKREQK